MVHMHILACLRKYEWEGDRPPTAEAGDLAIASVPAKLATACCC